MSVSIVPAVTGTPPIVGKLRALFEALPDKDLLEKLTGPKRRGRPGFSSLTLWHCWVAYYSLGLESVSELLRTLVNNPFLAEACGCVGQVPSQPTLSRFGTKLARPSTAQAVKNIMRSLTRTLHATLPDFGKSVAIDGTDIKGWSHGGKKSRKTGQLTDPDAGWSVKTNTEGNKKYVWGYKVHLLCDTTYELPLAVDISAGNVHDLKKASPLLNQASRAYSGFNPDYVICDAAYSSFELRRQIKRNWGATPIIDPNPRHLRAIERQPIDEAFKAIYRRRTSVERLNSRLKVSYRLNHVRVRGRFKVRLHAFLSVVVLLAQAVACPQAPRRALTI